VAVGSPVASVGPGVGDAVGEAVGSCERSRHSQRQALVFHSSERLSSCDAGRLQRIAVLHTCVWQEIDGTGSRVRGTYRRGLLRGGGGGLGRGLLGGRGRGLLRSSSVSSLAHDHRPTEGAFVSTRDSDLISSSETPCMILSILLKGRFSTPDMTKISSPPWAPQSAPASDSPSGPAWGTAKRDRAQRPVVSRWV
jgi:hypothetical protein